MLSHYRQVKFLCSPAVCQLHLSFDLVLGQLITHLLFFLYPLNVPGIMSCLDILYGHKRICDELEFVVHLWPTGSSNAPAPFSHIFLYNMGLCC